MDNDALIAKTANYVKKKMVGEGTGHDWRHVHRVWRIVKTIATHEPSAGIHNC